MRGPISTHVPILYLNEGVRFHSTVYNLPMHLPTLLYSPILIRPLLLLLAAALLLPSVTACGRDEQPRILVYAAASLKDVLTELGDEYESANNVHVAFNWGGSVALASQLKRHAPGDAFISAGSGPMDDLQEAGLMVLDSRITLASNSLVLAVSSDADPTPQSLEQTLREASLVGLADPKLSPAGIYARESLESMGLWHEIHENLVQGPNVRTALAYVESGATEAGIVYRTDALNSEGVRIAHEIPPEFHSPILYPAALLKDSPHQTEASLFLTFLTSEAAQSRFKSFGFEIDTQP